MRIVTFATRQNVVPVIPKSVSFNSRFVVARLLSDTELCIKVADFVWLSKSKLGWSLCYNERIEVSGVSDLSQVGKTLQGFVSLRQASSNTALIINPKHHKKHKG